MRLLKFIYMGLCAFILLACDYSNLKTQIPIAKQTIVPVDTVPKPRITPRSMHREEGVTIVDYDTTRKHKSKAHYENLVKVLYTELELPPDSVYIMVIFISEDIKAKIELNNPDWRLGYKWVGLYTGAGTILISEEGDDTFFHEVLHYLYNRGTILQGFTLEEAHRIIYIDEQFLVLSKTYIEYITSGKL